MDGRGGGKAKGVADKEKKSIPGLEIWYSSHKWKQRSIMPMHEFICLGTNLQTLARKLPIKTYQNK
jgi:hypothetical protein